MKNINRILPLLVAISLLFISTGYPPVLAQNGNEPTGFKNVRLWVNPEYDDPWLLVMLEGQIEGIEPPTQVRFLVPATAEVHSAGSMDAQRQYSGGPPERAPSSIPGWDEISYELTTDTFRVEYYDPIIVGQPDKSISYEFRWLYPISIIQVIIQEPRRASNFNVSPLGGTAVDGEGFDVFLYTYRSLKLDGEQPLQFDITYTKSDARPSLSIEAETSGSSLVWLVVIAAGVLVAVGFIWMRKGKPRTRAERRRLERSTGARIPADSQSKARFCTQCGKPAEGQGKFCRHCGAKL